MSCSKNILQQMAALRDSALKKYCGAEEGAIPFLRPLIIRTYNPDTESYSYEQHSPTPYVKQEPKGTEVDVGGLSNVRGDEERYQCHLSRQYDRDAIENQLVDFIIDGDITELEAGDRFSGILCELDSLDDKVTYWESVLIERISEQIFTLT